MKQDFVPKRDGDLDTWEENFITKLALVAAALGLTAVEVSDITTIVGNHRSSYSNAQSKKNDAKSAVEATQLSRKSTVTAIRAFARMVKSKSSYTSDIGDLLRIIGSEHEIDLSTSKPTLKLSMSGGNVKIEFNKGDSDGVKIYSKRGNETTFTYLATDTESPYMDTRANAGSVALPPTPGSPSTPTAASGPEKRSYHAFYILDDGQVGLQSDEVSINV